MTTTLHEIKPMIAQGYAAYNSEFSLVIQPTGHGDICVLNPFVKMGHIGVSLDKAIKVGNTTEQRADHPGWILLNQCLIIRVSKEA